MVREKAGCSLEYRWCGQGNSGVLLERKRGVVRENAGCG